MNNIPNFKSREGSEYILRCAVGHALRTKFSKYIPKHLIRSKDYGLPDGIEWKYRKPFRMLEIKISESNLEKYGTDFNQSLKILHKNIRQILYYMYEYKAHNGIMCVHVWKQNPAYRYCKTKSWWINKESLTLITNSVFNPDSFPWLKKYKNVLGVEINPIYRRLGQSTYLFDIKMPINNAWWSSQKKMGSKEFKKWMTQTIKTSPSINLK